MKRIIDVINTGDTIERNTIVYVQDGIIYPLTPEIFTNQPYGIVMQEMTSGYSASNSYQLIIEGLIDMDTRAYELGDTLYTPNLHVESGFGYQIGTGTTAATAGVITLTGLNTTVSTTAVGNDSIIILTVQGGTLTNVGSTYVASRIAGTSFNISSTNVLDTSNVGWIIIKPTA